METSGFTAALLCGGPPTIILLWFVRRWWEPPPTHTLQESQKRGVGVRARLLSPPSRVLIVRRLVVAVWRMSPIPPEI